MDATLIYPHQLFRSHPAIAKGREIYLIGDHLPFFLKNPRLAMMARSWEKMDSQKQARHRREADGFLAGVR